MKKLLVILSLIVLVGCNAESVAHKPTKKPKRTATPTAVATKLPFTPIPRGTHVWCVSPESCPGTGNFAR